MFSPIKNSPFKKIKSCLDKMKISHTDRDDDDMQSDLNMIVLLI